MTAEQMAAGQPAAESKLVYEPEEVVAADASAAFDDLDGNGWRPMIRHSCTFEPHHFERVMVNLVNNPNLNSKWLFRADILFDDLQDKSEAAHDASLDAPDALHPPPVQAEAQSAQSHHPQTRDIRGFTRKRTMVRKLIPRNTMRDDPLDQTCSFYTSAPPSHPAQGEAVLTKSLVIYTPHVSASADIPFYHPKVRGIAQLHEWDAASHMGTISVHFLLFQDDQVDQVKLGRIAYHLLQILHKHGQTTASGYVKRVHHDVVVPQQRFQNRYSDLKNKYARSLVESWAETTDPSKHVFEDLGIAAFLIELWADMYQDMEFPGFVDIGCGNGLLVHVLKLEGYSGWGFDARARKSWAQYNSPSSLSPSVDSLQKLLLLPSVVPRGAPSEDERPINEDEIHNGVFPKGTFIISNHADELTPWTPILATISDCPFITIPCCSHSLTGDKYRAPAPRDKTKGKSTFASLVDWVTQIAEDCGWKVETEMLRIPSTRNTGLVGRRRTNADNEVDIPSILRKYGGVDGYFANVAKLLKAAPRGH
ncbi:uracil-O(2)--methyltransferase [Dactylonectria estremocensis]|uniref:tRNA (uracil-O(2)-)-methyltransferase n=1 Tax=Dactylonectria estremocensis TaxID=1079267 RepID=A0A9P9FCJ6_9HYPO|nr:uracil-O(2)--methyltransferase [Dactylonectria estremocensis]